MSPSPSVTTPADREHEHEHGHDAPAGPGPSTPSPDESAKKRRKVTRSRLGCLTCRKRRKLCDMAKPCCDACSRLKMVRRTRKMRMWVVFGLMGLRTAHGRPIAPAKRLGRHRYSASANSHPQRRRTRATPATMFLHSASLVHSATFLRASPRVQGLVRPSCRSTLPVFPRPMFQRTRMPRPTFTALAITITTSTGPATEIPMVPATVMATAMGRWPILLGSGGRQQLGHQCDRQAAGDITYPNL